MQENRGSTDYRIAFCIPGYSFSGTFLKCWTHLIKDISNRMEWFMVNGYFPNVSYTRQSLLDRARMLRPTHYMWIDDDQVFKTEHFDALLNHDLDIVSGLYKKSNDLFACCKLDGKTLSVDDEVIDGVREVTANGMGFMLTKSKVFEFIHKPFDNLNDDQWEDFGFGAIKDEWMRRAFKLDGSVSVETKNGVMAEYKFRGIDMEGAMLLDDENGNRSRLRAGKVRFL